MRIHAQLRRLAWALILAVALPPLAAVDPVWRIYSYSGSGGYDFWLDRP